MPRRRLAEAGTSVITIDALANALKSRGFRRTPGSPRLITRLRRIKEITIDRAGRIVLVDGTSAGRGHEASPPAPEALPPAPPEEPVPVEVAAPEAETDEEPNFNVKPPPVEEVEEDEEASPGNELSPTNQRRNARSS